MRRFLDRLYYASGALGALFILALCALMIAQSVLREFGVRTGAVNDVVAWFCAAASFFSMAHVQTRRLCPCHVVDRQLV